MHSHKIAIHYQDSNLLAVEKPCGLLVHAYKKETNERNHLLRLLKEQTGLYLYPVHRLDRPVSGIVLFGLNPEIVRDLQTVWHDESTRKEYIALAKGTFAEPGFFDFPLFAENKIKQTALTHYTPLEVFKETTLLSIRIHTGRKHQIRRHFSRRCANIVGDRKYGQGKINRFFQETYGLDRIFLHGSRFQLNLPSANLDLKLESPLPQELQNVILKLRSHNNM